MIFATVGSHPSFGFDRLLRALERLPAEELIVQHGPGQPPPGAREAVDYMSFAELVERMAEASVVISHAGVGSILCAIGAGHVPVVMPRQARFEETVDDHQVELARALAPSGRIVLLERPEEIAAAVAEAGSRQAAPLDGGGELVAAVRAELTAAG